MGLANITTGLTALSGLLLVTPNNNLGYQPQNNITPDDPIPTPISNTASSSPQPPTFLFNYEGEQTVTLTSDITDHFVEDNTAVQDQISLKPELITTQGFIAELTDIVPQQFAFLKTAASKLSAISSYAPALSATAINALNEAFFLYQNEQNAANTAVSAINSLSSLFGGPGAGPVQTKQAKAFMAFYGYWQARYLFTVQTPWCLFKNMAIQTLKSTQNAETNTITDFEITFKKMRFVQTQSTAGVTTVGTSRLNGQASSLVNNGTQSPPTATTTLGNVVSLLGPGH